MTPTAMKGGPPPKVGYRCGSYPQSLKPQRKKLAAMLTERILPNEFLLKVHKGWGSSLEGAGTTKTPLFKGQRSPHQSFDEKHVGFLDKLTRSQEKTPLEKSTREKLEDPLTAPKLLSLPWMRDRRRGSSPSPMNWNLGDSDKTSTPVQPNNAGGICSATLVKPAL
ncbi:hypothetical protein B0H17DRAFT_1141561 [Mycena rosella]|uniref:Uncharacterized protein n=1 Tax=Mycena rosella TaxID=1033263 RepID=A0AAD7CZ70_MYCRO|nr:hypothetical protein B0H17DRAFT_1141561 [Mycena rosella]